MSQHHWDAIYQAKDATEVSWHRPHLERSLALIASCGLQADARIVDVGGGASTLADDLLMQGHTNLAVIDLSGAALAQSRQRLGVQGDQIDWIVGDATKPLLGDASVDLWHDRAVFHFLTDEEGRAAYVKQVTRSVKPGGFALLATFALDGPERCSGLPIVRYDADGLAAALGPAFTHVAASQEDHQTPWGSRQSFVYCLCRRTPGR